MDQDLARSLDKGRLRVVLATVGINLIAVTIFAFLPWSNWRTGLALNLLDNVFLLAWMIRRRDGVMGQLILFGLVVGFVELPSDAWLVDVTKSLDYSIGGGPMLWRSPIWMPLAWEVVAVQFGVIGMMLYEKLAWKGLLMTGILGAINIPFYEEMALRTKWWRYHDVKMFPGSHTPWGIIIGEFLIAVAIAYLATWTRALKWARSVSAGILAGGSIFVGYWVGYLIT